MEAVQGEDREGRRKSREEGSLADDGCGGVEDEWW